MKKKFTVYASKCASNRASTVTAASRPEDTLQDLINMIPNMRSMLSNIDDYAKSLIAAGSSHPSYFNMMDTLYENLRKARENIGPANYVLGQAQYKRSVQGGLRPIGEYDKISKELTRMIPDIESLLDELEGNLNTLSADFGAYSSDEETVNHLSELLTKANELITTTNFLVDLDRHKHSTVTSAKKTSKRRVVAAQVWDDVSYDRATGMYLPSTGEGDTMASQIVTAVNKLIYKWYNDGDVFDNSYYMEGWANDLSSYANWLYKYVPETQPVLNLITSCNDEVGYERILKKLMDACFDDEDLENWNQQPKTGSIYNCEGPFKFIDLDSEDEEDW